MTSDGGLCRLTRTEHVALKGTRDGLVLYLDPAADFGLLINELNNLMKNSDQFLQGASVRCYAGKREFTEEEHASLATALNQHRLELAGWLSTKSTSQVRQSLMELRKKMRASGRMGWWKDTVSLLNAHFVLARVCNLRGML